MRWGDGIGLGVVVSLLLAGGCVAASKTRSAEPQSGDRLPAASAAATRFASSMNAAPAARPAVVASALVFDPPIVADQPRLELSRSGRWPEAFWGFDAGTTTYFYLRVDDRIDSGLERRFSERYQRRAVTQRFGLTYR